MKDQFSGEEDDQVEEEEEVKPKIKLKRVRLLN